MLEKDDQDEDYSEMSKLKDDIKIKEGNIKSKQIFKNKDIDNENKPLKIFGNNINERKPKYYGKTKSLLFFKESPILILCEDCNYLIYLI